ncbi:hypothetical protein DN752_20075 [Echinicola strongylocentroti]|uniref:Uncharacterized protein n=1 Tax=Echinicola strongylocentroti TaxID=1795355 RepID=A0A2Z4IPG7_9BACT|nr:hypothetical protein DN752_20075 [Echinicola strongylocentroti]
MVRVKGKDRAKAFKKMFLFAFISAVPTELTLLCVIIFSAHPAIRQSSVKPNLNLRVIRCVFWPISTLQRLP